MRLFLNETDGTGMIACPACGLPLILAAERKGRWVVGYDHLHLRVGRSAMLVCPDLDCSHREDVEIAGTPDDAVVYSSRSAASLWGMSANRPFQTLGEIRERLAGIAELHQRTGNPKAPSAYRFWRDEYRQAYSLVVPELKHGMKSNAEVVLQGKQISERGRVIEILPDSVLLDRSENNETVLVPLAELHMVSPYMRELFEWPKPRFDFHDGSDRQKGNHPVRTPTRFAILSGHRVVLAVVNRDGTCCIETADATVAQALGLRLRVRGEYQAMVPAGLIERCFKAVRWCYVRGHRLELRSATVNPDVFQLRTRSMEAARALKMRREWSHFLRGSIDERQQLRWWGYFHQAEFERIEEKQIPLEISELVRAEQVRYRRAQARAARAELEWAALEAEDEAYEDEEDDTDDEDDDQVDEDQADGGQDDDDDGGENEE